MRIRLLLLYALLFSCKQEPSKPLQIQYYETIYAAERKVLDKDLDAASKLYSQALQLKCGHFAKDYYNQLLLASQIGENADEAVLSLLRLGVSLDYLQQNPHIKSYLTVWHENEGKIAKVKACKEYYLKNTNFALINKLDSLLKLDQKWRLLDLADGHGYDNHLKEINETDAIVGEWFLKIVAKHGFPSEQQLGYQDTLPTGDVFYHPILFPLIHQNETNKTIDLSQIIPDAVLAGKLHPETAAVILDYHNTDVYGFWPSPFFNVVVDKEAIENMKNRDEYMANLEKKYPKPKFARKHSESTLQMFNKNRQQLGIPNYCEFINLLALRSRETGYKSAWNDKSNYIVLDSIEYRNHEANSINIEHGYPCN